MFKFELKQVVFYMKNNKIHSAPVLFRSHLDGDITFGWGLKNAAKGTRYGTCHGLFQESELFASMEDLIKHLLGE